MPRTAKRKVYFYRVHLGNDRAGRRISYDVREALGSIDGLEWTRSGRYMPMRHSDLVTMWVDSHTPPQRIRAGKIRRANLPQLERSGELEPLDIPEEAGVAEQTHAIFFPDGILGLLFNFYGPRASSIQRYLVEKHPETPRSLEVNQLLRRDVLDDLDRLGEIRVLELTIRRSFADAIGDADESLGDAFQAARDATSARQIGLTLRPEPYGRESLGNRIKSAIRGLAQLSGIREEASTFKVKGINEETHETETVDVLRDLLVQEETVVREGDRTRAVQPESAYEAIEDAYDTLHNDLEIAIEVDHG